MCYDAYLPAGGAYMADDTYTYWTEFHVMLGELYSTSSSLYVYPAAVAGTNSACCCKP